MQMLSARMSGSLFMDILSFEYTEPPTSGRLGLGRDLPFPSINPVLPWFATKAFRISISYCCYGDLLCQENYNNAFTNR